MSNIATFLAQYGVAPGAYIYVADAALVTEDNLAARGDTLCITRLPATYSKCGWLIAEAVAHNTWEEVGVLAHTKPTTHRPGWDKKVTERPTTFMMVTKFAGVIVLKCGDHRQLAHPLSAVQQRYLTALDVRATCCTRPTGYTRHSRRGGR